MKLLDFLKNELVFVNLKVTERKDLLKKLYENLNDNGYVRESFYEGILKREEIFPTGLPLEEYSVAIPHTDAEHVIKPCISVAILDNPVKFKSMEDTAQDVYVSIVFMLALDEPHSQLEMLKQLIELIQNKSILKRMLQAKGGDEVIEIIKSIA